jgi:hypothetical protein
VHDVAIHVAGAAPLHRAVEKDVSLEIIDSEITAVGEDATGIFGAIGVAGRRDMTLERSYVSAEKALDEPWLGEQQVTIRLIDSNLFGRVFFDQENSLFEIVRTDIVGDVTAKNDHVRVVFTDSSIKGDVDINAHYSNTKGSDEIKITNTNVDGDVEAGGTVNIGFDGLSLHGNLWLQDAGYPYFRILRSYIRSTNTVALSTEGSTSVQLEQAFVQGGSGSPTVDISGGSFEALSSVLAGPVVHWLSPVPSCADTYGADYELLDASCQPKAP